MVTQNVNLNIRIPKYLRNKFIEITKKQELKYSSVLRSLIKDYISKHSRQGDVQDGRQGTDTI